MTSAADLLLAQARNNAWANATLHAAVAALSPDAYRAQYPSFFGSIPRTLNHIYEVDLYYVDALLAAGRGRSIFARDDIEDRAALAEAQAASDASLSAHCERLDIALLATPVIIERPDGPSSERRDHVLLHVFQHQVHHRGQVHAMLSQAGVEPPQLDEFFLEWGRAPTALPYLTNIP
jgi:uncharacterized damage-inducible protein DinB